MKSLILFDTNFGNTKKIAETIAVELGSGARAVSVIDFKTGDLVGIELLVAGSPIIGWKPSENMSKCLDGLGKGRLNGIKAVTFDTRVRIVLVHGDAAQKIAGRLEAAGAEIIAKPQAFLVKGREGPLCAGEIERAVEWAKSLCLFFN